MPTPSENQDKSKASAKLAGKVIRDQQLLWKVSDRVYELMLEDLRHQKERSKS